MKIDLVKLNFSLIHALDLNFHKTFTDSVFYLKNLHHCLYVVRSLNLVILIQVTFKFCVYFYHIRYCHGLAKVLRLEIKHMNTRCCRFILVPSIRDRELCM